MSKIQPTIYTVGHSTREIGNFLELLNYAGASPRGSHDYLLFALSIAGASPHGFRALLKKADIGYRHLKELGGLRHARKNSVNTGWRNASFRGFADYMQTADFEKGLDRLKKIAEQKRIAIMCAEAVPWRCHRSLVADALVKQKWQVFHIQSRKTAKKHKLTSFLRVRKGQLIYP